MTFNDLNLTPALRNALDDLGYTTPTTIQHKAFSVIMSGRDVCGIAQTGTGKTFAYLLPCLRLLKFQKDKTAQLLILVPTRELVVQVVEQIGQLCTYLSFEAAAVYGGANIKPQIAKIEAGVDIVVATPGRLLDLVYNGSLKIKTIKKLVIDEVDEMLNLGFRKQLNEVLDLLSDKRQNLLFSATITPEVEVLMSTYFKAPERIEAAPTGTPLENIDQIGYLVPNFNTKVNLLKHLLDNNADMSKVLIFVATKKLANKLFEELEEQHAEVMGVIHSNKEQNHRFNTVKQFHEGNYRFIIATDIVARGLDIAEVTHVVNFDIPDTPEHYIHRIGRTGRADKQGVAIAMMTEKEQTYRIGIEGLMKYEIPIKPMPEDVVISDVLIEAEKEKVTMKTHLVKLPKREESGPAFHEKKAKNQKVNRKIRHADKMMEKYGKPKKRGKKR